MTSKQTTMPTLADVAALAGVSKATASKALADRYDVGKATKERVLKAAEELNFIPNFFARGLGGGKTQTVGFITSDFEARFVPEIMAGVEDALGADRSLVILCNSRGQQKLENLHVEDLMRRSVDGLIMVSRYPEPRAPIPFALPIPVVYAYGASSNPSDSSIVADNFSGAKMATKHLLECGKLRLACIAGPADEFAAIDRAEGFTVVMQELGRSIAGGEVRFGDWTEQWGWEAAARLLDEGVKFDGLVCGDDQIARGALDLLQHRGIRIPDDVAVIGYDNWKVISERSRRPFSSVDMNLGAIGRAAAQMLSTPGGPPEGIHNIEPTVIVRGSTRRADG